MGDLQAINGRLAKLGGDGAGEVIGPEEQVNKGRDSHLSGNGASDLIGAHTAGGKKECSFEGNSQ